jgi:predicted ArsR family transcriptional regulator
MTTSQISEIIPREPTFARRQRTNGPSTPLDEAILEFLGDEVPRELQEITKAVGATTHNVHARVQSLVHKGLVARSATPGGPPRGPGASTYRLADWES